jgi:hypothetical protein
MRSRDEAGSEGLPTPLGAATGGQTPVLRPDGFSDADADALAKAYRVLEHESLPARIASMVGRRFVSFGALLPAPARFIAARATSAALRAAMRTALRTLDHSPGPARLNLHRSLSVATGAAGGAFGLAALPLELPASTTLILRAIADVARSEGEDLRDAEVALACLEVFALGGRSSGDDDLDSSYFLARGLLAQSVSEAAKHVARHGVASEGAPAIVRLMTLIGARFGVSVSQKAAAQAVPIVGAVSGAALNYAFATHFQTLAKGHFTMRRLERAYGAERVRAAYDAMAMEERGRRARIV